MSISENATIQFSNVSKDYSKGPQGAGIISSFPGKSSTLAMC